MRERILQTAKELISRQGLKFTMADLAAELGTSKRTFYEHFDSKEQLIGAMVDEVIDEVKMTEQAIYRDDSLTNAQKLEAIIALLPKGIQFNDRRLIADLKRFLPEEWQKVDRLLQEEWGTVMKIIVDGIDAGEFRNLHVPTLIQMMKGATVALFEQDFLVHTNITLAESVRAMADVFMKGLVVVQGNAPGSNPN
ncbi:TetR/AcrR family transcriptional regulator [Paenibacillus sp. TRM 82003]|nr:TetR/AcrR family transcriptional regulator [Paenibacillus sp. TRM 82003]